MRRSILGTLITSLFLGSSAWGDSLTDWINKRAAEQVLANIEKTNSATKQVGTLGSNENPTSLVDQSSAADLISFALNQAGFSTGEDTADSMSASATVYSLLAALRGVDPLDPVFYRENAALRRFSLDLGFDEEGEGEGDQKETTRLYGMKWRIIDGRQPTEKDREKLLSMMNEAGFARGRIDLRVQAYLFTRQAMRDTIRQEYRTFLLAEQGTANQGCLEREAEVSTIDEMIDRLLNLNFGNNGQLLLSSPCERRYFVEWVNRHAGASFDPTVLTEEDLDALESIIETELEPLITLRQETVDIVQRAQMGRQAALVATYKDLPGSGRAYIGKATFDSGISERWTLTLNADYEWVEETEAETDKLDMLDSDESWGVAGQLRFQLTPETLTRRAMYLDLEGKRNQSEEETTYKLQAKTSFPLTGGITIPLSVTYASEAELIEEDEIRGQVGFSIDFSKLVEALRR